MPGFIFFLYRFLVLPLVFSLLQLSRPFSRGKWREMIEDKNHHFTVFNPSLPPVQNALPEKPFARRPLWIHAASGEIEYARSLLRELRRSFPQVPLLVTYSSPSAKKILREVDVDAWTALPWDFQSSYQRFIQKWNPRLLLIARTDVWPGLALAARKHHIPSFLFSATFAANSSRLHGITRFLTQHSLTQLSGIFCVSTEDAENLKNFHLESRLFVQGDTRFDQVLHRLQHPKELKKIRPMSKTTIIFGSTWPEDENIILPVLAALKDQDFKFILAPHETSPQHLQDLEHRLHEQNLSFCRYSETSSWQEENVLLVDQVGILAELYTWAQMAFVGGSFRKQVHSVMEPLAAGVPVLVGPFHTNNREALAYQKINHLLPAGEFSPVQIVSSALDLEAHIRKLSQFPFSEMHRLIIQDVQQNLGATEKLLQVLHPVLIQQNKQNPSMP